MTMDEYNKRAEELIENISTGNASEREIEGFITEVRGLMKNSPSLGSALGPLIPRIRKALSSVQEIPHFDWLKVASSP